MKRTVPLTLFIVCTAISCAQTKKAQQVAPLPSAIPSMRITRDTTATALRMSALDIKTVVAANIATTTFDIRFYNPNDRILEGELEFPLADGQQITRYALDIDGSLREGVVVEKAKARVAFESTIRRKIDPGLVEKTKGNNFRTRIYPLPAKGYRRIVIAVEQVLEQAEKDLLYQLPLYAANPIDTFSINVSVIGVKPQLDENGMPLRFNKQSGNYVASRAEKNFVANQTVAFRLPATDDNADLVLTENHEGHTYFYVNSRLEPAYRNKKRPASIGILWDISASGEKRDIKKEIEFLQQYLASLGNVPVSLIPFNIAVQPPQNFSDAGKLTRKIESFVYDGGTQFGAIDLTRYDFDEILLFSDGLSTFGKQDLIFGAVPVTTITTSPSANYSYLKYIAQHSHGRFIDLGRLETAVALKELGSQSLQIINVRFNASEVSDIVTQTTPIANRGLSFAGKLVTPSAGISVELGFGKEVLITKNYRIEKKPENDYDQVKRVWAGMQIGMLDLEYEKNKKAITELGKKFSIVTQNTSLLVLDRLEDYVEHEIVPPAEMQQEYFALLKEKQEEKRDEEKNAFDDALSAMNTLKDWWNTSHTRKKKFTDTTVATTDTTWIAAEGISQERLTPPVVVADENVPEPPPAQSELATVVNMSVYGFTSKEVAESEEEKSEMSETVVTSGMASRPAGQEGTRAGDMELNEWKPDAAYLKILEKATAAGRFSEYLSLKKQYSNQPSFFVDAARFFIEKKDRQTGLQVLSNVCEMKLEDAELLRIVANQLLEAGEKELAIVTFQQIMGMREEDPQSYRDLALAYNESGQYNKAVEMLYHLVTGTWDIRFGDVKSIALMELNAIISAHTAAVNTSGIDPRFIYAMPVDIRIVIGWSSDNSDIDLWVTDPAKEKCFYQNTETGIGGRISSDVTQGYGPEEFLLKKAVKGNYTVQVNLYGDSRQSLGGPITIRADLFTDFGKPTQKKRTINFRVTTTEEVINLGSLRFGS